MNFVGSVGKLMVVSGLKKLMTSAFSGVEKMLISKKFPMNVRAPRFVINEFLRGFIDDSKENKSATKFYFFFIWPLDVFLVLFILRDF